MGNFLQTQNSFSSGEISSDFFGREGINGLSRMLNIDVLSSGALTRRRGLMRITELSSEARLIAFSVAESDDYLIALRAGHLSVYRDGERVADMSAPWGADDIARLQYAQRFGTMIFVHPNYQPRILQKDGERFSLTQFYFSSNSDIIPNIPFIKFDDRSKIKITVSTNSNGNNHATLTADSDCWTSDDVGGYLYFIGKKWLITEYGTPRVIVVQTNNGYTLPSAPVNDWQESAFGAKRGWPCSISFHQNRLVFGGSRSWPSGVWMSRVGDHHNFDVGTGLDDEAIFITLLSEQRQQIVTMSSSDNLQILTSAGEWAISNKPLTPASVNIKQHTSVGSYVARYLAPQKIESGTVFVAAGGRDIREMSLDELGENYRANDLCALSKHLIGEPMDIAYNVAHGQLFVVMDDGTMSVLNKNSALGIGAWGQYKTTGQFKSVAAMDGETYVVVRRESGIFIERFSDGAFDDDGAPFEFAAAGLPVLSGKHAPNKIKVRKISARVLNTKSLFINGQRAGFPNAIYADGAPGYDGDVTLNMLGTTLDVMSPIWYVGGTESFPATILSITVNGWYLI